jgi:hypothetical protein
MHVELTHLISGIRWIENQDVRQFGGHRRAETMTVDRYRQLLPIRGKGERCDRVVFVFVPPHRLFDKIADPRLPHLIHPAERERNQREKCACELHAKSNFS